MNVTQKRKNKGVNTNPKKRKTKPFEEVFNFFLPDCWKVIMVRIE